MLILKHNFRNANQVVDCIKEEPLKAYFYLSLMDDMVEEMNDNAEDLKDGLAMTAAAFAKAILLMTEFVFFPVTKLVRFLRIRNDVLHGKYMFENKDHAA